MRTVQPGRLFACEIEESRPSRSAQAMFESNEDLAELFEHSSCSDQSSTAAVDLVLADDDDEQEEGSGGVSSRER